MKNLDRQSLEQIAAQDETNTMSPANRRRIRKARRQLINYDSTAPDMCSNCINFNNALISKATKEYFPPRCEKHKIEVVRHAVCDDWEPTKK